MSGAKSNRGKCGSEEEEVEGYFGKWKGWKNYKKWSNAEEAKLNCLKSEAINIADTVLGRLRKENIDQMKATIKHVTKEGKRHFYKNYRDQKMIYTKKRKQGRGHLIIIFLLKVLQMRVCSNLVVLQPIIIFFFNANSL